MRTNLARWSRGGGNLAPSPGVHTRAKEPTLAFEDVVRALKRRGKP